LLTFVLCACLLLVANLLFSTALLNLVGVDTEFVGFGFVLMGAIICSVLIMVVMIIREVVSVTLRGRESK